MIPTMQSPSQAVTALGVIVTKTAVMIDKRRKNEDRILKCVIL